MLNTPRSPPRRTERLQESPTPEGLTSADEPPEHPALLVLASAQSGNSLQDGPARRSGGCPEAIAQRAPLRSDQVAPTRTGWYVLPSRRSGRASSL